MEDLHAFLNFWVYYSASEVRLNFLSIYLHSKHATAFHASIKKKKVLPIIVIIFSRMQNYNFLSHSSWYFLFQAHTPCEHLIFFLFVQTTKELWTFLIEAKHMRREINWKYGYTISKKYEYLLFLDGNKYHPLRTKKKACIYSAVSYLTDKHDFRAKHVPWSCYCWHNNLMITLAIWNIARNNTFCLFFFHSIWTCSKRLRCCWIKTARTQAPF